MAVHVDTVGPSTGAGDSWYVHSPEQVAADLGVDPVRGLAVVAADLRVGHVVGRAGAV